VVAKGGSSDTIVKCNVKNELLDVLMAVFTLHLQYAAREPDHPPILQLKSRFLKVCNFINILSIQIISRLIESQWFSL